MFSLRLVTASKNVISITGSRQAIQQCFFSNQASLKRTKLYDLHLELKGKMVEFAGWEMPVQYPEGILKEHFQCREKAALFDVSHMAQLKLTGKDRVKFLESLCVADLQALPEGHSKLSVYTNEKGGIIDDTVITNKGDHVYVVVNAGCADKDIAHYKNQLSKFNGDVKLEILDRSLLAIQGPSAAKVVQDLVKFDLKDMAFMTSKNADIAGIKNCIITRCGYTGEDGFEISVDHDNAVKLAKALLNNADVKPAGLGSRDSLRLEAGLCLYGHDLNEDISPVEGNLTWTIGKRRKEQGGFIGSEIILSQLKSGVSKKRVGFIIEGAPAREGAAIVDPATNKQVGAITSGTFSPVLKKAIAMGYIETPLSKLDTKVHVNVRGKNYPAVVAKMPFVANKYYRKE